jgi:anti-anti-sigma factor
MEMDNNKQDNISLLRLKGKLDFTTSSEFEQKFNIMVSEGGKKFIFDLSEVNYMSSAGLRLLLIATKKTKGNIVLNCVQDSVKQVIEIAGFLSMFRYSNNIDEAANLLK